MFVGTASTAAGTTMWTGSPGHQGAHEAVLDWLRGLPAAFPTVPGPPPVDNRLKGNLGETIAAMIGRYNHHAGHRLEAANALNPFSNISHADVDLVWLYLDPNGVDDWIWLQEVKATSDPKVAVAASLVADHDKLFGQDVKLTLKTRLGFVAMKLQHAQLLPQEASRVRALTGRSPRTCASITLEPTIVADQGVAAKATSKLVAVRTSLIAAGWAPGAIESHLIEMDDLEGRLLRLANGQP